MAIFHFKVDEVDGFTRTKQILLLVLTGVHTKNLMYFLQGGI